MHWFPWYDTAKKLWRVCCTKRDVEKSLICKPYSLGKGGPHTHPRMKDPWFAALPPAVFLREHQQSYVFCVVYRIFIALMTHRSIATIVEAPSWKCHWQSAIIGTPLFECCRQSARAWSQPKVDLFASFVKLSDFHKNLSSCTLHKLQVARWVLLDCVCACISQKTTVTLILSIGAIHIYSSSCAQLKYR